jgi:hypothetical protein
MNLMKRYGAALVENACQYALINIANPSYRSIKSILQTKIYQQPTTAAKNDEKTQSRQSIARENIRGKNYYQSKTKTEE